MEEQAGRGLTVSEVAARYRVSPDKVRGWIRRGELKAFNRTDQGCRKPRWVITPEALAEFEKARTSAPEPKPTWRQQRNRYYDHVDFYPSDPQEEAILKLMEKGKISEEEYFRRVRKLRREQGRQGGE